MGLTKGAAACLFLCTLLNKPPEWEGRAGEGEVSVTHSALLKGDAMVFPNNYRDIGLGRATEILQANPNLHLTYEEIVSLGIWQESENIRTRP